MIFMLSRIKNRGDDDFSEVPGGRPLLFPSGLRRPHPDEFGDNTHGNLFRGLRADGDANGGMHAPQVFFCQSLFL
jgi:hypothetical protein